MLSSIRPWLSARRFAVALAGIGLIAFGVRLAYAEGVYVARGLGDDWWYHWMANAIGDGRGFNNPLETLVNGQPVQGFAGEPIPTAFHPPLFPAVLAVASKLGITSYGAHRAIGCAMGAVTAIVCGLCGRRIGGPALGIASAALAAVFPPLVANDSTLLSESLYGLLIACVVLAVLRLHDAPSTRRAALLGAAIGLAALTRSEAVLLVLLLVPFVARRSWRIAAVAAGVAILIVVPWCIRNTIAFDRPVTISTGDGYVLSQANTNATYYGDRLGAWDVGALNIRGPAGADVNEAIGSAAGRKRALEYAGDHLGRLPVVVAARVLRTWSLYPFSPRRQVSENTFFAGSTRWSQWVLLFSAWIGSALAIVGALKLRARRWQPLAPLLAPIVLVTLVSALFNGDTRYRDAAEISIVLLAAVGAQAGWTVARARYGQRKIKAPSSVPSTNPGGIGSGPRGAGFS